jgi:hypothetical protein
MMTLVELKERLKEVEETELIDMLGVTSEDIVEAFTDLIEDKMDKLIGEIDE